MANKKSEFTKKEIKAGIMVLLSAIALFVFVATVSGLRPTSKHKTYYAHFTNIIGLDVNADVRFGGVNCGRVASIAPDPVDQSKIRVEVHVAPGIPVNEKSIATIEAISLTTPKHLEISTGEKDAAPLAGNSDMKSVTKSGSLMDMPDVSGVIARVEDVLDQAMDFLGVRDAQELEAKGGREFAHISDITADIHKTLNEGTSLITDMRNTLNEQSPNIRTIVERATQIANSTDKLVKDITDTLAENRKPVHSTLVGVEDIVGKAQKISDNVSGMTDKLAERLDTLANALQGSLDNAASISGNARQFLEMNRPAIEDTLLDLRESIRYLKNFSRTLSEQPQSIITGKKPEGRKN